MTSEPIGTQPSLCCRLESILCGGIGSLWGQLDERWWGAWWLLRHMLYFGMAATLLLLVPNSSFFVVPFFIVVHAYKGIRACVMGTTAAKQQQQEPRKAMEQQGELETGVAPRVGNV